MILASGGEINSDYLEHALDTFLSGHEKDAFLAACGQPLRKSIRVNTLKISVEDFHQLAARNGWLLTQIPWCQQGFWIDTSSASNKQLLGNTAEHLQGLFYIQEASSMLPPAALLADNQTREPLVIDMAAAPGSKTTQLAAMLKNRGIVLANELSASRLKYLSSNLLRCGILNTLMSHHDARKIGQWMPEQFDFVLLDAPCGGEGTVRKDIDALKHWDIEKVRELACLQQALILSAYQALKPGGRMVYSTCTLSPEENQQVANFLIANSDAQIEPLNQLFEDAEKVSTEEGYLLMLPQVFNSEGFFIACFSKPDTENTKPPLDSIYTSPFEPVSQKSLSQVVQYYQKHFALDLPLAEFELKQRDKEIWLFPQAAPRVNQYLKVNRGGIQIARIFPNKIRSSHEFASCLGALAKRQTVEINSSQFECFVQGKNIELDNPQVENGEVILTFNGSVIGIGQNQRGKVKNGLPRELVKDNYQFL